VLININPDHNVVVITHHRISTQINRKHRAKQFDAIHDPLSAVFEIKTGVNIFSTQEGAPHTTADAMVIGCVLE